MDIQALKIRDVMVGDGIPKICVPIVARSEEDILGMARVVCASHPDCVEWRLDWFEEVHRKQRVSDVLFRLRERIGDTVLLATFRTKEEGGEKVIPMADYRQLCERICRNGSADLIDIEAYREENLLRELCQYAHDRGVLVVASSHDFLGTPDEGELVERLEFMDAEGADIPKLAVMPQSRRDVLSLLSATLRYRENGGKKPIVTMSMDKLGIISRLAGEVFGSAITFAAVGRTSAPGQIPIGELRGALQILHGHTYGDE